jgi:hypothetical protein
MPPRDSALRSFDGNRSNAKHSRKEPCWCGAVSDNDNLLSGQPGKVLIFSYAKPGAESHAIRVLHVLFACAVFEIFWSIIRWSSVDVVDLLPRRNRTKKCRGNDTMEFNRALNRVHAQGNAESRRRIGVAPVALGRSENPTWLGGLSWRHSLHPGVIGNFVKPFIANNWSPSFFIHARSVT